MKEMLLEMYEHREYKALAQFLALHDYADNQYVKTANINVWGPTAVKRYL